jgi:ascorbate-specific PTS system EIIC-type component UlaA
LKYIRYITKSVVVVVVVVTIILLIIVFSFSVFFFLPSFLPSFFRVTAAWVSAAIPATYTAIGGMRASLYSDALQALLMCALLAMTWRTINKDIRSNDALIAYAKVWCDDRATTTTMTTTYSSKNNRDM